jgi:hypothetical protein
VVPARQALQGPISKRRQLITLAQGCHFSHPLTPLTLPLLPCLLQATASAGTLPAALKTILKAAQLSQALIGTLAFQLTACREITAQG